jgi:hypothetical protein
MGDDEDDSLLREPWQGMGPDLLAEGAVAALSLGLAGPSAALAVFTPIFKRSFELAQAERRRRIERAEEMWLHASNTSGRDPLDLIEVADADDDRRHLAYTAGDAAATSRYPERIRALGKALAEGLLAEDDAVLDYQQQVIDALSSVDRPHLAILQAMTTTESLGGGLTLSEPTGYTWQGLKEKLPGYRPALRRLLATLEREGLVEVENGTYPGGTLPSWHPSDFGQDVLARLTAIGGAANTAKRQT